MQGAAQRRAQQVPATRDNTAARSRPPAALKPPLLNPPTKHRVVPFYVTTGEDHPTTEFLRVYLEFRHLLKMYDEERWGKLILSGIMRIEFDIIAGGNNFDCYAIRTANSALLTRMKMMRRHQNE